MSAPIIVSQLGDVRESAREKEKSQGLPRTAGPGRSLGWFPSGLRLSPWPAGS